MRIAHMLARWFPTPHLLAPKAAGIDITDGSIKWLTLEETRKGIRVASWGNQALLSGVVVNGSVRDVRALREAIAALKKRIGASHAHASLPEEGAYVFSMHVPDGASQRDIRSMVEFELEGRVPLPVSQAVYDYDVIEKHHDGSGAEISVVVFPRELAEGYASAFARTGIKLLSLEVEARSVGRAVIGRGESGVVLLVDAGKARTGFAILRHGIPIFTSTVDVGGWHMTETLMQNLGVSEEDAENFKNDEGLVASQTNSKGANALEPIAASLAGEIVRHYHFWDTRRNEHGEKVTPVDRVLLVGGSANLRGIADYIAGKAQAPTERPNVWQNVCSFDDYIPPISRRASLQYATTIGLALRGLPAARQTAFLQ